MSQTNSLPPFNEIINLADYASKGQVTRDVGSNWQYLGQPSEALGGLQGSPLASPLATPFLVGTSATDSHVAARHEATTHYRQWLWQQITSQSAGILDALRAIGPETVLACWCDPPCYCRIIARAAAWFHMQESSHLAAAEAPASYKRASQPPAREAQEDDLYCAAHDAPMKRWTKGKQSWVSHRLPDGRWCRGSK